MLPNVDSTMNECSRMGKTGKKCGHNAWFGSAMHNFLNAVYIRPISPLAALTSYLLVLCSSATWSRLLLTTHV